MRQRIILRELRYLTRTVGATGGHDFRIGADVPPHFDTIRQGRLLIGRHFRWHVQIHINLLGFGADRAASVGLLLDWARATARVHLLCRGLPHMVDLNLVIIGRHQVVLRN